MHLVVVEVVEETAVIEVDRHEAGSSHGGMRVEDPIQRSEDQRARQLMEPT